MPQRKLHEDCHEAKELPSGIEVTERAHGHTAVHIDGETVVVQIDHDTQTAMVTESDGTSTEVDMSPVLSYVEAGEPVLSADNTTADFSPSNTATCSFLMWVVGIIHSSSWIAAIAAVAATGAVGAAVLATMYALGANGFLYWVGTQC